MRQTTPTAGPAISSQGTQTPDAVVPVIQALAAISFRSLRHNHAPFFRDHQKQQPIDESKKLAVELGCGQSPGLNALLQSGVFRVPKESCAEGLEGIFDAVAKFVTYTPTLLDGKLEVFLQPA